MACLGQCPTIDEGLKKVMIIFGIFLMTKDLNLEHLEYGTEVLITAL